ncbi:MAG: squalene--hopene cyclase [Nitrospina sp.]|nr:squalene--hopene cyclase [Nitrospina sp.]MBT6601802.1 squalene--hopene cyclase [Nitrospina sp.]
MKDVAASSPTEIKNQGNTYMDFDERLDFAINKSRDFLLSRQTEDGYWVDELESNATITAELIFFMHFTKTVDLVKQKKLINYLLHKQRKDGSWPLYFGGPCDINSTVESYMALKLSGVPEDLPEMIRAREAIFANGGIKGTRVFTKIFLAMFGQIPWEVCPAIPVEIILLKKWFPLNIYEMSSWSRGTVVPLSIVVSHKPVFDLPEGRGVKELFTSGDNALGFEPDGSIFSSWRNFFIYLDKVIKFFGKFPWKPFRKAALKKALRWVIKHQEDQGDFAGIQPAMLNSLLAYHYEGISKNDPKWIKGLEAVERFLIDKEEGTLLQACVSPLWDTAIAANALCDSGISLDHPALLKAAEWILSKQVVKEGDWFVKNPQAMPGGWAFEFYNELYPDCDDTAEILIFLNRVRLPNSYHKLKESERAVSWLLSMQCQSGGWAAFDINNEKKILNEVPFADHGAMLDPPTVDVSGRVLWLLGQIGFKRDHAKVEKVIGFIKDRQEIDGSWWGRWGVNYIYGSWLALTGLASIGEDMNQPYVRRTVEWYEAHQNEDGGWGETCESYKTPSLAGKGNSTASQTAWALMGMIASGEEKNLVVKRGIEFLLDRQEVQGSWCEDEFTGTGFPMHFFIKYHMYQHFFPLMALGKYRSAIRT